MIHRKKRLCRISCSCRPFTSNKRGAPKTDLHRTNQQKTVFFAWVFHRAHLFWQNFLHFPSKNWSRSLLVFGWHSLCPQPWTLEIEAWNYTLYRIYGCCWVTWGKKKVGNDAVSCFFELRGFWCIHGDGADWTVRGPKGLQDLSEWPDDVWG